MSATVVHTPGMNLTPSSFAATSCIVPAKPTNATPAVGIALDEEKTLQTLTPALASSKSPAI